MNPQRRRRRMYAAGLLRSVGCLGLGAALGLREAWLVLPLVLSLLIGLALRVWSGGCCVAAEGVWCRHGLWGLDLVPWSEVALFERRSRGRGWRHRSDRTSLRSSRRRGGWPGQ